MKYLMMAGFLLGLFWSGTCMAEQPLLQEGKKTVFERVVSHPGAVLYQDEGATKEIGKPRTFTSYYVYEKKGDAYKVGVSASRSDGWLKKSDVTPWHQAITMVFTPNTGRDPVLFFKDQKDLIDVCSSDGIGAQVAEYVELFSNPKAPKPAGLPVIAAEPSGEAGQVQQKDFYLLPVLQMNDEFSESGTRLLEVACIDPGNAGADTKGAGDKKGNDAKSKNDGMKMGIVFVVDTTMSMGPYIDQTKEIIRKVYDSLQHSPAKDNVAIAVVAYRSNVDKRPDTEYNTKIISDFTTVNDREKLEALLEEAQECQKSTHAFDEDAMAGVQDAVDKLSWDGIDSRAMLLITDAGPLAADDATSRTGMSPEGMASLLKRNNIYMTVAHVKSPSGKKDHAYAEKSYRELSLLGNGRSSYIPIDAPNVQTGAESFNKVGSIIAERYRQVAELTASPEKKVIKPPKQDVAANASPEERARQTADAIGYAMQLQFAGNQNETRAPQVVSAWIADADLTQLEKNPQAAPVPVVEPAVLLTKAQLSQLRKQLKTIIETAEEAFLQDSENFNFYEQLLSAAAQMSRDPSSFTKDPGANLAQKGVVLEVLDGLPYKSQILRMKQEDWSNMSTGEQQLFIRRLKGLVSNYEKYDRDNQHWEGFGSPEPNEWVYRVPLRDLP